MRSLRIPPTALRAMPITMAVATVRQMTLSIWLTPPRAISISAVTSFKQDLLPRQTTHCVIASPQELFSRLEHHWLSLVVEYSTVRILFLEARSFCVQAQADCR